MHFLKGTTTLAFIYEGKTKDDKGGIVVSVDSRASSGIYVSTSTVMKVLPITSHIVATMAGGAADCQFWMRVLAKQCRLYELQNKEKISVAAASKLLANLVYGYKGMGLSMGTMVAGFDKRGPSLYYVDNDGVRCKGEKFSVGSGSLNAMGVMDTFHKKQMSDAEAIDLGRRAIMHATFRDSGSGGGCNLFHITKEAGWDQKERLDVSDMYYKHLNDMKRELFDPKL
jgi:20S proteasome subunit beta 5